MVDQADLLRPEQEVDAQREAGSARDADGRQFVVATVPGLEGRTIEDYGYRLGRAWAIGDEQKDDGVMLLVAPNERKVRIETGYGARVFLTDAVSGVIIRNSILPKFKAGDMGGGIVAGADADHRDARTSAGRSGEAGQGNRRGRGAAQRARSGSIPSRSS